MIDLGVIFTVPMLKYAMIAVQVVCVNTMHVPVAIHVMCSRCAYIYSCEDCSACYLHVLHTIKHVMLAVQFLCVIMNDIMHVTIARHVM